MLFPLLILVILSLNIQAEESIDYVTEHLFETAMNARYHQMPYISPYNKKNLINATVSHFEGGPSSVNLIQLSIQRRYDLTNNFTLIYSLFSDVGFYSTSTKDISASIIKNQSTIESTNARIAIPQQNSYLLHPGVSISLVSKLTTNLYLQLGIIGELLHIKDYSIHFTTIDQSTNFAGTLDYNNNYYAYTPYFTLRWFHSQSIFHLKFSGRFIFSFPMPRKDLVRTITVGDNIKDLTTNGKHIPDGFAAIGYIIEPQQGNWMINIGASLFMTLLEGKMHKGITSPFTINYGYYF